MKNVGEVRILVVDDYPLIRMAMRTLLADSGRPWECCGEAGNRHAALEAFEDSKPDLVMLDFYLGQDDSYDLVKEMRLRAPGVKILILSCSSETSMIVRVLRAGADGFVVKDAGADEIREAIEVTLAGENYLSPSVSGQVLKRMLSKDTDEDVALVDRLTDREFQVLQLLGTGKGNREIAAQLGLSPKTIETYREKLKTKLGLADSQQLLLFAGRHAEGAGASQTGFHYRTQASPQRKRNL
jgi:DNA-binding NarL/FixJ family response regulator